MQTDAQDDLKIISQARGAPLSALPAYVYDARGGQGVAVYIIDTGINPNHPVRVADYQLSLRLSHSNFRNSEICHKEGYVGSIYRVNHGSKLMNMVMELVLPQKS